MTPVARPRSRTPAFRVALPGRGIVGRLLPRILGIADLGRPIPVGPFAGAGSAGGYLSVLSDGRRLPACGAFGAAGSIR